MKKILIIDNGGTVSMKRIEGALKPVDGKEDIKKSIYEIKKSVMLFYTKVNQIDSSNLSPQLMKPVYEAITENYPGYDGFIVLTGTDTLAYLSSFLSFWLIGIQKPVVITGAQKPLNMLGSDAPANIYYSILFACENIPEVSVFFGKNLYRGNRVTKIDSQDFDSFESPNYFPIGHVDALRLRILKPVDSLLHSADKENFQFAWSEKVHVCSLYPGMNPKILTVLQNMKYRGLIIEAFGMGNLPDSGPYSLSPAIKNLVSNGVLVGVTSKCLRGSVQVEYDTARTFEKLNVLFLRDITTEAAYAKMSFLIGVSNDIEYVKDEMKKSVAGEMSDVEKDY